MTIVALTRPPVKPTRKSPRKPAPFGEGILASHPTHRLPCLVSDLAWAAQTFGEISDRRDASMDRELDGLTVTPRSLADAVLHEGSDPRQCRCYGCVKNRTARYATTAEDRHYDHLAACAAAVDRHERGLMAPDLADYVSRTSLVGHMA